MTTRASQPIEAMRRAVALSKRGFPAPNPHVGCVIVQGGALVGEGFHDHAGGPHAEAVALAQAGERARGADVFVTLEPCRHQGITGPCTEALIGAGVGRVFFACKDPTQRAGGGAELLRRAGIPCEEGLLEDRARIENHVWLKAQAMGRPYVVAKAAVGLDGRIALPNGESQWITGEQARRKGHWLRAQLGCVLVGSRTVQQDDPRLTARIRGVQNQPLRVVLDPDAATSTGAKAYADVDRTVRFVACGREREPFDAGLPVKDGLFQPQDLLAALWGRGVTSLLIEGGAATVGGFVSAGLVDRLELFFGPKLLGSGLTWLHHPGLASLGDAPTLSITGFRRLGPDLWITAEF